MSEAQAERHPLELLAARFPQLYVAPAEGASALHRLASGRGVVPEGATLAHFTLSPEDELREVETPAGPVEELFLAERADFETLLQIIEHKAEPVPIARTVGAKTYRGLADWGKVAALHASYVAAGGQDWPAEFRRIAQEEPTAFRSELVIISAGPYSNIPASQTPYDEDEWLRISREIRLHHECAHVVCRRLMPEDKPPVWDELTADVVGLICATGGYSARLACTFLGATAEGYTGGRLAEYLSEEQQPEIDRIARECHAAAVRVEELADAEACAHPFDFLLALKREPLLDY